MNNVISVDNGSVHKVVFNLSIHLYMFANLVNSVIFVQHKNC